MTRRTIIIIVQSFCFLLHQRTRIGSRMECDVHDWLEYEWHESDESDPCEGNMREDQESEKMCTLFQLHFHQLIKHHYSFAQ